MNKNLEVGDKIAIMYGDEARKAIIISMTNDRYLVKLDIGLLKIMNRKELEARQYVILENKPSIFHGLSMKMRGGK